jgi:hypothetical protein
MAVSVTRNRQLARQHRGQCPHTATEAKPVDWLTPLDDETLACWQEQLDALIGDIDALIADITATSPSPSIAVAAALHANGAVYE